jgi:hypothetical protein
MMTGTFAAVRVVPHVALALADPEPADALHAARTPIPRVTAAARTPARPARVRRRPASGRG